ncbi:MAG: TauD/TfdA dioxygenase family protein [Acidimicrobiales bacterium]
MEITTIDGKGFGAVVTSVKLSDLSDEEFATIHATFLDRGFLVFPGQFLTEAENIAFGERFGPLEFGAAPMSNQRRGGDGSTGDVYDIDSQIMRTNLGNEAWHTDSTYKPVSSKCAMLSAVIVPAEGGETELADARAGYAALDQETQHRIEGLSAYHSTQYSQANDLGDFPPIGENGPYGSVYHGEAFLRPLVKVHPETGVKNLFIGRHAFGIPGLGREESRELLRHLLEVVVSDETRTYLHRWQPGDTLIWDNRSVLHRARPFDYAEPRYLIGTRVAGDDTELAYHPTDPEAEAGRRALAAELDRLRSETTDRRYRATTATH